MTTASRERRLPIATGDMPDRDAPSLAPRPAACRAAVDPGTLADVLDALPGLYSDASAAANRSKINKAVAILGMRPELVTADPHRLRPLMEAAPWQGHFRGATDAAKARKFDDLVARAVGICARYQEAREPVRDDADHLRAAWDALEAHVREAENTFDEEGRRILPNMASLSIANLRRLVGRHLWPSELTGPAIEAAVPGIARKDLDRLRRSVAFLDRLVREQNRHPAIAALLPPVEIGPLHRRRAAPLAMGRYPESLEPSIVTALDAVVRDDRHVRADALAALGEGVDPRKVLTRAKGEKRVRNKQNARKTYRTAINWLVREAEAAEILAASEMTGLAAVLRAEVVEATAAAWQQKAAVCDHLKDATETATLHSYLNRLEVLCRRALGDEVTAARIALLRVTDDGISNPHVRGMARAREEFVQHLMTSPESVEALVRAPFELTAEARRRLARWDDLSPADRQAALRLYVAGLDFGLQVARPIRPGTLRLLTIAGRDRNLLLPLKGRGSALLRVREKKNGRRLEHALPAGIWAIVEEWLSVWRRRWIAAFGYPGNDLLVPGASASGAVSEQTRADIWNLGARTIGLPMMTGHMARHACATIHLAAHPGDYETVSSLLGDELKTVRDFYGRDTGSEAAARYRVVLEAKFPALFREMRA